MATRTTIRSVPAIGLGLLFVGGTAYVLFEDVLQKSAPITTDHVLSAIALTGVIYAAHAFFGACRDRRVFVAVGYAALLLAGSFVLFIKSSGRNAETFYSKSGEITRANSVRDRADADVADARKRLRAAQDSEVRECKTGNGTLCKGATATRELIETQIPKLEAVRARLGAVQDDRAALRYAARLIALLPGVEAPIGVIAEALELLLPFSLTLVLELGSAVFLAAGFNHTHVAAKQEAKPAAPIAETAPLNDNDPQPGSRVRAREEVVDWVRAYRARHGRLPQIPEVQAEFPWVARSTAHRRIRSA